MKKVIWKFELKPGEHTISMPINARVLSVGVQNVRMEGPTGVLWALVDPTPEVPKKDRKFKIVATGEEFNASGLIFIGTIQFVSAGLVFHVFEEGGS